MKDNILENIDAAIALEFALSKLYEYFSERFPKEKNFWDELHIEEINHASLLKTVKDFSKIKIIPEALIMDNIEEYEKTIEKIENSMNEEFIPDLNSAFEFAYSLEKSSGEIHFQKAITNEDPDEISKIFIYLNRQDLNHASRILNFWKSRVMEQ